MWIHGGGFKGGIKHNPDIVEMAKNVTMLQEVGFLFL